VTVTAYDTCNNVATSYTGTVNFTSSDAQAGLPADANLTNGVGTFGVTLKTAGSDSITATDTTTSTITGSQTGIAVSAGPIARYLVTGGSNQSAGVIENVTFTAVDAYGNVATGYTGTVHFTSTDPKAALPADAPLTKGVGTFNVTFKTGGTQAITATDPASGATGSLTGVVTSAMIQGTVYLDQNANGTLDAGESRLAGRVVYLDLNHSGTFRAGDPTATTDAQGHFSFPGVAAGSATVLEATAQDATLRNVVDRTATAADGSLTIGAVLFSSIAPAPVPTAAAAVPGADATTRYVQSLYRAVLGRNGTDSEVAGWTTSLAGGMTPQQVAAGFYTTALHRPREGQTAAIWTTLLKANKSPSDVANGILSSPEFQQKS